MPVTVSARLTKSRYIFSLVATFYLITVSLLVWAQIFWLLIVAWVLTGFGVAYWLWKAQSTGELRWQGHSLSLGLGGDTLEWQWTGRGRASSQFIALQLLDSDQRVFHWVVWRGQLNEVSWRACHMAFNVWRHQRQQTPLVRAKAR